MKTLRTTLLFFPFLFLMAACESGYDNSHYNQQGQTHDYNSNTDSNNLGKGFEAADQEAEDYKGMEIRDIWQKPEVVISKMGDLKDKVVADIGAGPYGFFTLRIANNSEIKKILAIDIDKEAIQFIENAKIILDEDVRNKIETRLVNSNDPSLKDQEADVVLIVNTYSYFENAEQYLKNVKKGISKDGRLIIIDFKKRNTPVGPPLNYRTAIGKVEQDLLKAGYVNIESDDQTLAYQYIIIARPGLEN